MGANVTNTVPATATARVIRPITLTLSRNSVDSGGIETASTRWETFRNQPHLVAPLVGMIGNSVVTGMSAEGPEFVSSDVLALLPEVWNGCPICLTHPNGIESACTPETLSLYQFGVIFNGRYENGALQMEAWLSPQDAESVSPDAVDCVNRIVAGEPVEISICPWVRVSKTSGVSPLGIAYEYRWEEILGADHVAILPSSMRGACSVDMGCGTPRALASREVGESAENRGNENTGGDLMADATVTNANTKTKTGFLAGLSARIARISQFLTLAPNADDGTSTYELSDQLYTLLRATEPGFEYINAIYPETKAVVYCCYPGKEWKDFRRTYNLDSAGVVTLNDDRVEVVRHETWEPVETATITPTPAASSASTSTHAQCSCRAANVASESNANANQNTETVNGNVNETDNQEETMGNETATGTTTTPVGVTAPVTPAPATAPNTSVASATIPVTPSIDRAAVLSALGITEADLVAIRSHSAAQTDRKQVLVSALAEAQETFSTEQLNAMDTATLEGVAALVLPDAVVDSNGNVTVINPNANLVVGDFRGARPRSVANAGNETYTPPDPLGVNALLYGGEVKVKKPASGS